MEFLPILLFSDLAQRPLPVLSQVSQISDRKTKRNVLSFSEGVPPRLSMRSYWAFRERPRCQPPQAQRDIAFSNPVHPHPARFPSSIIARQKRSDALPVICDGSPSLIRSVRLISLGMTTRPNSSILRTMPVARTPVASLSIR